MDMDIDIDIDTSTPGEGGGDCRGRGKGGGGGAHPAAEGVPRHVRRRRHGEGGIADAHRSGEGETESSPLQYGTSHTPAPSDWFEFVLEIVQAKYAATVLLVEFPSPLILVQYYFNILSPRGVLPVAIEPVFPHSYR